MKKILMAIAAIILITACSKDKKNTIPEGIAFKNISVDSISHLTDDPKSPALEVKIDLVYAEGKTAQAINDTLLRSGILIPDYFSLSPEKLSPEQIVDSFVKRYTADYKNDYLEIYRQDPQHAQELTNFFKLSTKTEYPKEGHICYIAKISYYGGGLHSIEQTLARNFDVKSGRMIHLADIFVPGHEQKLSEAIKEELMDKYEVDDWKELEKRYFFADGKIYATENFILGEDEITFIYCEDEVAPHVEGEIRVTLDMDDLDDILKRK